MGTDYGIMAWMRKLTFSLMMIYRLEKYSGDVRLGFIVKMMYDIVSA
jgi:hypothetical protein